MSLTAAAAMAAGEVGGQALVDALATLMPGPDWAGAVDPLGLLEAASTQEMAASRHAATVLAGVGGLYLMHGLGMPDTPALARLRAFLEESGFSLIVTQTVPMMINPSGIVHALAMCLAPEIAALAAWLESVLTEQAGAGKGLLPLPGDEERSAEAFMHAWTSHLHQLTDLARRAVENALAEHTDGAQPSTGTPADTGPAGSSTAEDGPARARGAGRTKTGEAAAEREEQHR
ncbi:hypothetical protein AB0D74_48080 [Streptomyces sp. NPDC048278]|uniref:hypothetical protein n=1 Tax=Streptomyces sp. NPDC048278 TaxID=3155809 RepID=UPI003418FAAC